MPQRPARISGGLLAACLLLAGLVSPGRAACEIGNETLEAHGRGSIALSRKYGVALHFAGLDGDPFEAGPAGGGAARVHLASNVAALNGAFPASRPYTADGLNHSILLLDARIRDQLCPGREIAALCSLLFRKDEGSRTGTSDARVVCQFTVL